MDPLALTATFFSIGYVCEKAYRVARTVKQGHGPRSENLWIRFLVEKARYADWKKRMGVETNVDTKRFLSRLPPDTRASLIEIIEPMRKYSGETEDMFKRYGIHGYDSVKPPTKAFQAINRVNFAIDGVKTLTELLDIVTTCNNGLLQLAPPAPAYHNLGADHIIPDMDACSSPQVLRLQTSTEPSEPTSESQDATSPQPTSNADRPDSESFPMLQLLLSNCVSTMRSIVSCDIEHSAVMAHSTKDISLWTMGMFSGRITLDQVLHGLTESNKLFREQIVGILVDIAIYLERITSTLDTADDSTLLLSSRTIFSLPGLAEMGIAEPPKCSGTDPREADEVRQTCIDEVDYLVHCLYLLLPTIISMFEVELSMLKQNPALDEREMVLLKAPEVASTNSNEPVSELLKIDLELIAAMQDSLRSSTYAKYFESKNTVVGAKELQSRLTNEKHQLAYWINKLNLASEKYGKSDETDSAVIVNLARVARAFQAGYKPAERGQALKTSDIDSLLQKHLPKDISDSLRPEDFGVEDYDPDSALKALKSSRLELQRLCGSKDPNSSYQDDFALSPVKSVSEQGSLPRQEKGITARGRIFAF